MKKLLYPGLAILVLAFFTVPGWAQKGAHGKSASHHSTTGTHGKSGSHTSIHSSTAGSRSNKGGQVRGLERAEQVQEMNTKADAKRGFTVAPGVEKAEGEATGAPTSSSKGPAQGKGKGKSSKGNDPDESKD